jgi:hypothetical protein
VKIQSGRINRLKTEIGRLAENNYQLLEDSRQITILHLREKEVTGRLKHERDSLAAALKIKPKQVEKIIYITSHVKDTIPKPVYINKLDGHTWVLRDSGKCWRYVSRLTLTGDSLQGERQLYENNNLITETFYKKRSHRFLFIQFGKWQYLQRISATCGDPVYKAIVFEN